MKNDSVKRLIIIDEEFEKMEGHPYEYNKSVKEIFDRHGFETVIFGRQNMLPAFRDELHARPWFTIDIKSKIRKIPVLGTIIYRIRFWKKFEKEIKDILAEVSKKEGDFFLFFPGVYWYNALPISRALKNTNAPAALLYRLSIFDTVRLPKKVLALTLGIIKQSVKILNGKKNIHYFSDSEVIAGEWFSQFKVPMKVLPIPHLTPNKKNAPLGETDKIRMYLPGGMRVEKGAQLLTEAFEILAAKQPQILNRIILVTQFLGGNEILEGYKARLAALPLENQFLRQLSSEEYNRQLGMADVILIPYQVSEGYRARTSGILAEAIASSKPFITTDGTWMSIQARKYNTGLIVKDKQPDELADAIRDMVSSYAAHNKKAIEANSIFMKNYSKEVYYQQLITAL